MSAADWLTIEDVVDAYRQELERKVRERQTKWQQSGWINANLELAEQGVLHAVLSMIRTPPPGFTDHEGALIKVMTEQFQSSGEPFPDAPSF